jgi:hypothetical protein
MDTERYEVSEDTVSPMAVVLADMPEVWHQLLTDHVADSSGRCLACRNHGKAGVPWPCTLQVIAADARALHQQAELDADDIGDDFDDDDEADPAGRLAC